MLPAFPRCRRSPVQARGRAEGRDDHLRAEERRRLVAGLRRGPPAHGEVDGRARSPVVENVPENATAIRPRGRAVHRPRATTSSSAPPSAIPTPSRSSPRSIRTSPSSTAPASPTARTSSRSTAAPTRSQYLCGMAAGAASKTGKLGFVAANPFGLVNWTVNAFALGAQQINPDATTTVDLHRRLERPGQGARRRRGADRAGHRRHRPACRHAGDADRRRRRRASAAPAIIATCTEFAPKATQCSSVWVWDQFLDPEIKKIAAGDLGAEPLRRLLRHQGRRHRHRLLRRRGLGGEQGARSWPSARRSSTASTSSPARSPIATARRGRGRRGARRWRPLGDGLVRPRRDQPAVNPAQRESAIGYARSRIARPARNDSRRSNSPASRSRSTAFMALAAADFAVDCRRGPCAARRERRRQILADERRCRPLCAGRGPDPDRTAGRSLIRGPLDAKADSHRHGPPALQAGAAVQRAREHPPRRSARQLCARRCTTIADEVRKHCEALGFDVDLDRPVGIAVDRRAAARSRS